MAASVDTYALTSLNLVRKYLSESDTHDASDAVSAHESAEHEYLLIQLINAISAAVEAEILDRQVRTRTYSEFYDGNGAQTLPLNQFPITAVSRVSVGRITAIDVKHTGSATMATVEVTDTQITLVDQTAATTTTNTVVFTTSTTCSAVVTAIDALSGWDATLRSGFDNYASANLVPVPARWALDAYIPLDLPYKATTTDYEIWKNRGLKRPYATWPEGVRNIFVEYTAGESTTPKGLEMVVTELVARAYHKALNDKGLSEETLGDYKYKLGSGMWTDDDIRRLRPYKRMVA